MDKKSYSDILFDIKFEKTNCRTCQIDILEIGLIDFPHFKSYLNFHKNNKYIFMLLEYVKKCNFLKI